MLSKGLLAVGLLCVSNIFMTCAWYLHLKLQTMKVINFSAWPIYTVVLFSWAIALFEYSFMVPANRIGFEGNGGPFSLVQLKIIQECITLTVFALFSVVVFQNHFGWNHLAAFVCLVMAVFLVFYLCQRPVLFPDLFSIGLGKASIANYVNGQC